MDLRDPVARMLNTCLIGRRWKPREGWSRPVLTGDGDITFQPCFCGWFRVFPVLDRPGRQYALGWSLNDTTVGFASRPLAGSQTATVHNIMAGMAAMFWLSFRDRGFAVVIALVRRPVPFRTR